MKCHWNRTMLNLCSIVVAILKMATGRNFSMSGINSGHHYVKFYVSIIIYLEVININVRNFNFPIGLYSNPHPLWTPQNMNLTPFTTKLKDQLETYIYNSTKFHAILSSSSWDLPWTSSWSTERKKEKENNNNKKKRSKRCLGDLNIIQYWLYKQCNTNKY